MKINKLTKQQKAVLETLLTDLDELDNKPRRLFHALEELAFVFNKKDAVPSIRDAQDMYYRYISRGAYFQEIERALREVTKDIWKRQVANDEPLNGAEIRINGASELAEKLYKGIGKQLF